MTRHRNLLTVALLATAAPGLLSGTPAAAKQVTIGFAAPIIANPWWKANAEFAQHLGEQLGAKVIIADANDQEEKQIKNIEDFIANGVDGIVVAPVSTALAPALLKRAEEAGIKMAFAERAPSIKPDEYKGKAYVGFVGTDQRAGGYAQAKLLYEAGPRKVVGLVVEKGNPVGEGRVAGWQAFAKDHSDFKILQVEWGNELREQALKTTENLLAAYPGPGFDGVLSVDNDAAMGAIEALKHAGVLDKVKVAGLDLDANGIRAMENGELTISSGGSHLDGGFATIMLFDAINGHMPKNRWVELNFLFANKGNVDAYKKAYVESTPSYDAKALSVTFNPKASTDDYVLKLPTASAQ
jgi:ABC-type sugar transport system substrate-binding protein